MTAKLRVFVLTDDVGWVQVDEADRSWKHGAKSVYRKPQSTWIEAVNHRHEEVYWLGNTTADPEADPNDLAFNPWVQAYWDDQSGRWILLSGVADQGTIEGRILSVVGGAIPEAEILVIAASPQSGHLVGLTIPVIDLSGCILDEDPEDLEDVWVVACDQVYASGRAWCVINRCCIEE